MIFPLLRMDKALAWERVRNSNCDRLLYSLKLKYIQNDALSNPQPIPGDSFLHQNFGTSARQQNRLVIFLCSWKKIQGHKVLRCKG